MDVVIVRDVHRCGGCGVLITGQVESIVAAAVAAAPVPAAPIVIATHWLSDEVSGGSGEEKKGERKRDGEQVQIA